MHCSAIIAAVTLTGFVAAHGKVTQVQGNLGGNGTALGIKGDSVARFGKNAATELDTTVFGGNPNKPAAEGLGKTTADGKLTVAGSLKTAMALSGSTLPQVSNDGQGMITGTWRVVTSDGTANNKNGDLFAVIDPTGTGDFSKRQVLTATTSMVGNGNGNVVQRNLPRWAINTARAVGIMKRATNVGADAKFSVKIPQGTTCTGTDQASGATGFCLLKLANNNGNGPFGGTAAFQISDGADVPAVSVAGNAGTKAVTKAGAKREVEFAA